MFSVQIKNMLLTISMNDFMHIFSRLAAGIYIYIYISLSSIDVCQRMRKARYFYSIFHGSGSCLIAEAGDR